MSKHGGQAPARAAKASEAPARWERRRPPATPARGPSAGPTSGSGLSLPKDDGDEAVLPSRRGRPKSQRSTGREERTLQSRSGKTRRSDQPGGTEASGPPADPPSRAQPRYLVTFDGLMEVPDMDDMIESLEREVEVIRSPALC